MAFSPLRRDGLDMRHRLPGHLGRLGGIGAVDADRYKPDYSDLIHWRGQSQCHRQAS